MSKQWKDSIKSESFWLRSIFMVLFFIVYRIVDLLVLLVAVSQWFYMLLSGDANQGLTRFAKGLSRYVAQIIDYLSYNSEEKPYPFTDWPSVTKTSSASPRKAARKTARKTTSRKTSAKIKNDSDQSDA